LGNDVLIVQEVLTMSMTSKSSHREVLMDRMATRNGADLDLARQSGVVSGTEMVEALVSCMGCSDAGDCEARLDSDTEGLPDYCRNGLLIARVKALTL
jgi:hypothetical protein